MRNIPGLAGNEPLPQQTGNERELNLCATALAELLATIDDMCRVQKQHRVRLMLVERSLRNLRQRMGAETRLTWGGPSG